MVLAVSGCAIPRWFKAIEASQTVFSLLRTFPLKRFITYSKLPDNPRQTAEMPVLDNRKNHPNQQRDRPNDSLNFMDYALENLENMRLDDVQLKQRQTKPHFINGDSNQQNQLIYEEYIQQLEQNLSRTRNTRVKATLFPEIFQDEDETNYAQLTNSEPNAVARLAECAQVILFFFLCSAVRN